MSTNITIPLMNISGYDDLASGSHTIQVVGKATGKRDSEKSTAVNFSKSVAVGNAIYLSLDGSTPKQYRVLKVNGMIAEIVALSDQTTSNFGSSQVYAGSTLDTYLNSTYYNTLTTEAKNAIVDKTFTQDSWYWGSSGNPVYNGYYGSSNPGTTAYSVSLANATFGAEITRHIYALSIQDVIDYVSDTSFGRDGKLQNYNIWKMFWNDEVSHSNTYPWLRSAGASDSSNAWRVIGYSGSLYSYDISNSSAVRPALTIDLSKISWS